MDLRDQLQQTFGDAYTVERELGGGGMSRVFVAMDNALGRRVVVKVLPSDMGGFVSLDRFRREIGIAARLQHAHLVPVLSAGEVDGIPYFLMPYIDGESLRAQLVRQGELPLSDAIRILREVASALAYSHAHGVVHRDIKPDNVLLSSGAAMVTDFGVAKAISESSTTDAGTGLTSVGVTLGTPAYMAPEQVSADPHVDARADIYAWGVMAYEMLAGQPPFAGRAPQALLAAQMVEAPEELTKRRTSVPRALADLVMRCLEKRAADRPQTADELVRSLDAVSTSSGELTHPRAIAPRGRRQLGRAVAAVVVLVLLVAGGWAAWSARAPATNEGIQSLAVIPLAASGDTADYFADGIIETLIAALAKVPDLEVRSSASSFAMRGRHLTDAQIGEMLHVKNILHVSVRRSAPRMRIIVDLARVRDGTVLWADQQERPLDDVFAVQDSIANRTAASLAIRLGTLDRARVSSFGTENLVAYDYYLRGRHAMASFDEPALHQAIALFDSALAKDPRYSVAYSAIAECWVNLSDDWIAPRVGYANAEAAAAKAVQIDSTNWAARGMLAVARVTLERDFARELAESERVFHFDSLHANSTFAYAAVLAFSGNLDSAAVIAARARALDPVNPSYQLVSGWTEFYSGHFDKAIAHYRSALALVPTLPPAWNGMGESLLDSGHPTEAMDAISHGKEQIDAQRSTLARTLVALNRSAEAKQVTAALAADASRRYVSGDYIAAAYIALGNRDEAMHWLERANDDRSQWMLTARTDPRWRPLHGDPRFATLLAKIGN